jgi:hypothetical protein
VIDSKGTAGRRRRGMLAAGVLATACGVVVLGSAGTASAGNLIACGGNVTAKSKKHPGTEATYNFGCTDDIRGFTIMSSKQLSFFGSETTVTGGDPAHNQSAIFQCEGVVPSFGFGCGTVNRNNGGAAASPKPADCQGSTCNNRVSAGNVVSGDIGFSVNPCKKGHGKKPKPKLWLIVTDEPLVTNVSPPPSGSPPGTPDTVTYTTGIYSSPPFQLKLAGYKKKC